MSRTRQNYTAEVEAAINKQINMELYASYTYMSIAAYFDRDDVALHNISKYFMEQSDEERVHAGKLIKYQNQRGGRVVFKSIMKPDKDDWSSTLEAFNSALELEKNVNSSLLEIHLLGGTHIDPNLQNFIDDYLEEQVYSIKELSDHITNLIRAGTGLGEYLFDKHFYDESEYSKKEKI